jgi:hypothetical protein
MPGDVITDPLARYLRICCNPNAPELLNQLQDVMAHQVPTDVAQQFKQQLAHAINRWTITPELYKKITKDNEYTTQDLVQDRLIEIWRLVYGDEPIIE